MVMLCLAMELKDKEVMGNLNNQSWDELWNSPQAEEVRKKFVAVIVIVG